MKISTDIDSSNGSLVNRLEIGSVSPNGKFFPPAGHQKQKKLGWRIPITPTPGGHISNIYSDAPRHFRLPHAEKTTLELFDEDRDTFFAMKNELLSHETYRGKFVAVHEGKVIDVAKDKKELVKRVYSKHGYIPVYIGKVEKEQAAGEMSSPERA